jgi:putative nucleotidyltransferase-like protein
VLSSKSIVASLRSTSGVLPEAWINVLCARLEDSARSRESIDRVSDWARVLEYGQVHGVLHFLATAVERGIITVPEPWRNIVVVQHRRNVIRAMVQHQACGVILDAFRRQGIQAVPFKGTSLSKLLYGRVADRISSDIDILVRESEFRLAREAIESLGYIASDDASRLDLHALLASTNEMIFRNAAGIIVELHWRVFEADRACGYATRFEDLHMSGDRIEDVDLFMILAIHGLTHRWETLKWVVDIDAFVRNVTLNWSMLFERATSSGTVRAVAIALLLAHEVLGTPLPVSVDDPFALRIARRCARVLLTGKPIAPIVDFWMQMFARERWIDRYRFLRFVVTPKPWDYITAGPKRFRRVIRLLSQSFRSSDLVEVQKIPELQQPAAADDSVTHTNAPS